MKAASSDARNATAAATSAGSPRRFIGTARSSAAISLALRFLKQSFNADSEHIGGLGQIAFSGLGLFVDSDEAREGVTAFNEKRAPDFAPYRAALSHRT